MARVFLDANVFLYAIGGFGPHCEPCCSVFAAVAGGKIDGVTSTEVLQEVLHVRARRADLTDAASAVRSAAALVTEVLPVALADILTACQMLDAHPKVGARDAVHAAVMSNAGIATIVSVDKDFDVFKHLQRMTPHKALAATP